MTDRILHKYTGRRLEGDASRDAGETLALVTPSEGDVADDFGAFGWVRGIRDRAIMLELRKKDGNILAIGYGWLERVEFDPSEGITLHAMGQKIRIRGRNLNGEVRPNVRLFQGLTRHRVSWIQESDGATLLDSPTNTIIIESIELK